MKIAVICKSDSTGGAAVVSRRLTEALRLQGHEAEMLVLEKRSGLPFVIEARYPFLKPLAFLAERLQIFINNGFNRKNLFKTDSAAFGLPLWKHPAVKKADMVILNWVNQGMLSLKGIEKICNTGKKVVWVMHDMWNLTGVCHHAMGCRRFEMECGECPLLCGRPHDLSFRTWRRKSKLYETDAIRFVAVSNWLAEEASRSSLMRHLKVEVIPNAFNPLPERPESFSAGSGKQKILFAAASLDNWIKGLSTFKMAIDILSRKFPISSANSEVLLLGSLRDPAVTEGFAIPATHIGTVSGDENIAEVFRSADVIVNCSHFENLPGTLVEGQAYGAIPVAFDRGGQRDIITHKETGFLADWAEDEQTRAEAIAEGIDWALRERRENGAEICSRMRQNVEDRFSYRTVALRILSL